MGTTSLPAQQPETATVKTYAREWQEPVPGSIQPRAADDWRPDSAVIFTAAGEKSSKQVYTYDAAGKRTTKAFNWENNRWVPADSYSKISLPSSAISYDKSGISWPHPTTSGGVWFGFTGNGVIEWAYNPVPTHDAKGNLTRVKFYAYAKADPNIAYYLAYSYTFSYNGNGQPVLIEGYKRTEPYSRDDPPGDEQTDLFQKMTYEWDSNGNITFYENSELDENTGRWVITETCTPGYGGGISETYNPWSGEREKTVMKTDGRGNPAVYQYYTWTAGKWYMTHYAVFYPNDLVPAMEPGNNNPVDGTDKGGFDIHITVPEDSIAAGSFAVRLPDGFSLDKDNSTLTADFDGFVLEIIKQEDNSWLFTFRPKDTRSAALLSGEAVKTLAHVAYTVDGEVKRGTYDITVHSIQFETPGGESIVEPAITVPARLNRWGVGSEAVDASPSQAWSHNGLIHVHSGRPQQVAVYSLSGAKLYGGAVQAGTAALSGLRLPKGLYIIILADGESLKVPVY
jgi:hypothetical protein